MNGCWIAVVVECESSGWKEKDQRGGRERMWVGVMVLTGKAQDDG